MRNDWNKITSNGVQIDQSNAWKNIEKLWIDQKQWDQTLCTQIDRSIYFFDPSIPDLWFKKKRKSSWPWCNFDIFTVISAIVRLHFFFQNSLLDPFYFCKDEVLTLPLEKISKPDFYFLYTIIYSLSLIRVFSNSMSEISGNLLNTNF